MFRCIELAKLGAGHVAPNPMVGAVLVHEGQIIGEGYHEQYGQAHAEVNCINSVHPADRHLIPNSTLYVSLEPCSHFGKTPPCCDLIMQEQVKKLIIGCKDPFEQVVKGKGIEKLQAAGVEVVEHVLEDACLQLNKRFFTFHKKKRPYIILKWAQTADKKIGSSNTERLLITNELTNRLVHKWRSEEAAILVGTNTVMLDNPSLDNRLWNGKSPVRFVIDKDLKLPSSLKMFNDERLTFVFNTRRDDHNKTVFFVQLDEYRQADKFDLQEIIEHCYHTHVQSIIVEGGSRLLQSFINENLWNEARIITNESMNIADGLQAPVLTGKLFKEEKIFSDTIQYYHPLHD